ncbi:MAG: hypothetical protein R3B09_03530 [Nannocystaceae bacterium]
MSSDTFYVRVQKIQGATVEILCETSTAGGLNDYAVTRSFALMAIEDCMPSTWSGKKTTLQARLHEIGHGSMPPVWEADFHRKYVGEFIAKTELVSRTGIIHDTAAWQAGHFDENNRNANRDFPLHSFVLRVTMTDPKWLDGISVGSSGGTTAFDAWWDDPKRPSQKQLAEVERKAPRWRPAKAGAKVKKTAVKETAKKETAVKKTTKKTATKKASKSVATETAAKKTAKKKTAKKKTAKKAAKTAAKKTAKKAAKTAAKKTAKKAAKKTAAKNREEGGEEDRGEEGGEEDRGEEDREEGGEEDRGEEDREEGGEEDRGEEDREEGGEEDRGEEDREEEDREEADREEDRGLIRPIRTPSLTSGRAATTPVVPGEPARPPALQRRRVGLRPPTVPPERPPRGPLAAVSGACGRARPRATLRRRASARAQENDGCA